MSDQADGRAYGEGKHTAKPKQIPSESHDQSSNDTMYIYENVQNVGGPRLRIVSQLAPVSQLISHLNRARWGSFTANINHISDKHLFLPNF